VSLPHLLLVDDSEAILAYQAAALSSHYTLSTATNGREALDRLREIRPAAVLLDLSMPDMTGDELLARMQTDPALCRIPVIIVSSERARGEASRGRGARAFLPKPIRAAELQTVVARVLEEERLRARGDELAVLFLGIGPLEIGIPLEPVREVLPQPMTQPVPMGPDYLSQMIDYHGTPVLVLDLALRLAVPYAEPLHERKLVVAGIDERLIALAVDRIRAPEAFAAADVLRRADIGGSDHTPLTRVLLAIVKTQRGPIPVVPPDAFLSAELVFQLFEGLTPRLSSPADDARGAP
jgi:CheY-like chemotaxis protein